MNSLAADRVPIHLPDIRPGFGIFLAAFGSFDLRLAAILGPSMFAPGAGVGHIRQMVIADNFAPGNAGVIFRMDFLVPLFGYWLLRTQKRHGRPA